jgi:tetratricopeptide (TPR) repeat protein
MALEKGTFARRKAQRLARDGEIAHAIEEMRLLVVEAEADPYDHVYLGDLLMREGRPQEAVDAWMEAVHSYDRAGLNRNAIAVGKKVLRLDHGRVAVHRTLGELYYREGLLGEAMPHFLHWLDAINGDARFSEEFLTTLEHAGSAVGLQVEAALRIGDHYLRAGQSDQAARMFHGLADKVQTAGSPEMAFELRERARAAERTHEEQKVEGATALTVGVAMAPDSPSPEADAEDGLFSGGLTPPDASAAELPTSRGDEDAERAPVDPFPDLVAVEPPDDGLAEMPMDQLHEPATAGAVVDWTEPSVASSAGLDTTFQAEPRTESSSEPPPFLVEHFPVGGSVAEPPVMGRTGPGDADGPARDRAPGDDRVEIDATADEASGDVDERIWDLDAEEEALQIDPGAVESAGGSAGSVETGQGSSRLIPAEFPEPMLDASVPRVTPPPDSGWNDGPDSGERSVGLDPEEISWPSGVTLRSLVDRAEAAYESGQWAEARGLYDRAAHETSLEPMVLGRLVEIARKLEDSVAEVHYLEQLGDAWIEAGVMEEALEAFLEALRIDSGSSTARRRISRLQEMGVPGAERIPEATRDSVLGVLESSGARTSVRDDLSVIQSDEWIDLGALIEEFRHGIKNQIAGDDAAGHYDLAVSHHGMELFEEAVEELDTVLSCPGLAVEMELHARELRGVCLLALRRHREAVHEFRTALERPVPDTESRCSILYHLGVALESAEEWREAAEIFERVRDELPGFLDAQARQSACEMRAIGIDPGARAA